MEVTIPLFPIEWGYIITAIVFFLLGWSWFGLRKDSNDLDRRRQNDDIWKERIRYANRILADPEAKQWRKDWATEVLKGEVSHGVF